jgi:hypothetical protein
MKQDDVALALCSLKWANLEQTESELALETWKSQRRRQLLFDAAKTVATKASKKSDDPDGLSGGSFVSTSAELRKLRSLAREVLDARTKTSALGGGGSGGGASSSSFFLTGVMVDASNSITYPKVLYLYGTLMFFVFKVRCYRAGR